MGCDNPKEKVEDKMMKAKIALIEVQMEKYKQLELLKNIDGKEIKQSVIPYYLDQNFINKHSSSKRNSNSTRDDIIKFRRGRSRSKSVKIGRSLRINQDEQINAMNGKKEDKKYNENNEENKKKDNEGNKEENEEKFQKIKIRKRGYSQKKKRIKFQI